jgi:predicted porin
LSVVSGAVLAQSSVSISGRIDLGHANIKTTPNNGDATKVTSLAGDQHGRTTSRLTFSGVEDLGGGLKAAFNYETRLNPDNTESAGFDRTRNMFLGLSGGFGAVTIGTYLNPLDTVRGFSAATYSAPGGDFLANHIGVASKVVTEADLVAEGLTAADAKTFLAMFSNGLSGRSKDSIGYTSPSFGGVTASLGLSQEKTSTGNTALNKTDGMIGSLAYAAGPLNARLAFGQGKLSQQTTASNLSSAKTTDTAFAVSYDLGMAVPYIQHETTKVTVSSFVGNALTTGNVLKSSATEIGSKFPMGAFTPYVTLGSGNIKVGNNKTKTSAFQIGTTYDLSKRTSLYAAAGKLKLENEFKTTGYKVGLVHQF